VLLTNFFQWRLIGQSPGIIRLHKDPAFVKLSRILSTHHLLSTSFRTAKMSRNLFHDNLNSLAGNCCSFNNTATINNAYPRPDILTWLSPLEPRLRHEDIRERRARNVGEWVLQAEEFKNWYAGSGRSESDTGVLFCYGDPGVGKTFIR